MRASPPREQRANQQNRAANAADELRVGLVLNHLLTADADRRRPDAFHGRAQVEQQLRHRLDVLDPRHVGEHAFFGRQQARRQQRQRGVLVAFDINGSGQTPAAFNLQSRH